MNEFAERGRRPIASNSKFDIFFDVVEGEDGKMVPDYLVVSPKVKSPELVTGVAILPILDGLLGLARVYRHAVRDQLWEIPRGFLDPNEMSVVAAGRELYEETGLECDRSDLQSLGLITPEAGLLEARIEIFVARQCRRGKSEVATNTEEIKFFTPAEAKRMALTSVIQDPSSLVAILRYFGLQNRHDL